jgi:hypothetical protein
MPGLRRWKVLAGPARLPDREPAAFVDKHDPGRAFHARWLLKRGLVDFADLVRGGELDNRVCEQPPNAVVAEVRDLGARVGRFPCAPRCVKREPAERLVADARLVAGDRRFAIQSSGQAARQGSAPEPAL